jgi:hypothetical protein
MAPTGHPPALYVNNLSIFSLSLSLFFFFFCANIKILFYFKFIHKSQQTEIKKHEEILIISQREFEFHV